MALYPHSEYCLGPSFIVKHQGSPCHLVVASQNAQINLLGCGPSVLHCGQLLDYSSCFHNLSHHPNSDTWRLHRIVDASSFSYDLFRILSQLMCVRGLSRESIQIPIDRSKALQVGVQVTFDAKELGEILDIPSEGYNNYTGQRWPSLDSLPTDLAITRRFCDVTEVNEVKVVHKSEMKPCQKVIFEFVNKCLLPRQERRHIANYMDLVLMECLESGRQINWPAFIIKLLDRVINSSKAHATSYGFILTIVLDRCKVSLKKWEMATSKDYFGINALIACDYEVTSIPNELGSSKKTPINSKVRALVQESGAKDAKIVRLKARLAEDELKGSGCCCNRFCGGFTVEAALQKRGGALQKRLEVKGSGTEGAKELPHLRDRRCGWCGAEVDWGS
uniref:Uncharacterized protein LOC104225519 n=1 Tax=Nicotiana sylvestris TaxID=4096 RepID=A0A1U7WLV6_NICSY|nr:PREDICTED: uncharacterized protein LOC104225519 [Nicotiana sylvestris]